MKSQPFFDAVSDTEIDSPPLLPVFPELLVSACIWRYRTTRRAYPRSAHARIPASARPDSAAAGGEPGSALFPVPLEAVLARPGPAPDPPAVLPVGLAAPAFALPAVGPGRQPSLSPRPAAR